MTRIRRLIPLLTLLAACVRSRDPATVRAALADADRAFNRATAARRADGWMEFMAEDGALIRPSGTIQGRAAVRDAIVKTFAGTSFSLTWEPVQSDVGSGGDLGYTVGRGGAHYKDDKGAPATSTGRDLTIWKVQRDSSWKGVQDIGVEG